MALDFQTKAFIERLALVPPVDPDSIPIEDFRGAMARFGPLALDQEDVADVTDLPPDGERSVPLRVYRPSARPRQPVLVWAHGGSWVRCSVETHDRLLRVIANRSQCAVISVDYRLAPEHPYPGPLDDVHTSAVWAWRHAAEQGWDSSRMAIGGDSSGASLAAGSALLAAERGDVSYALQVLLVPVLDLTFGSDSWRRLGDGRYLLSRAQLEWAVAKYAPRADRSAAPLSPLATASFVGLPPGLVVIGEYDPCRDDGIRYARKLTEAGVDAELSDYPGLIHHAMLAPRVIDLGRRVIEETGLTIGRLLSA
jgi:acetyl esterase/lipase